VVVSKPQHISDQGRIKQVSFQTQARDYIVQILSVVLQGLPLPRVFHACEAPKHLKVRFNAFAKLQEAFMKAQLNPRQRKSGGECRADGSPLNDVQLEYNML
jgi:hypothetical protein